MAKTLKARTYVCPECGYTTRAIRWNYEPWNREPPPSCPEHGHLAEDVGPQGRSANVIGDDIPGGEMVAHAICNPDGTPKRYDTKSSMRAEARRRGWTISGETPKPAGDRWI